jgi:hypothetical protein
LVKNFSGWLATGLAASTTRQGILDQIINLVEGDVVDGALDFEEAGRFAFEEDDDGGFDRRAAGFYAGDFFDDDREHKRGTGWFPGCVCLEK